MESHLRMWVIKSCLTLVPVVAVTIQGFAEAYQGNKAFVLQDVYVGSPEVVLATLVLCILICFDAISCRIRTGKKSSWILKFAFGIFFLLGAFSVYLYPQAMLQFSEDCHNVTILRPFYPGIVCILGFVVFFGAAFEFLLGKLEKSGKN